MISQYWVDQIPARPLAISVKDTYGANQDLSAYTSFSLELLDEYNNSIDLAGSQLDAVNKPDGRLIFYWPTTRTVFERAGDYVLRLKMSSNTAKDFTTVHNIKVREFGRVNN